MYERTSGTRIVFTHTVVEPAFRGQGVGTALVRGALDDVRAKGLTLTNFCDFVGRYMQAHPEYLDLLDARHPNHCSAAKSSVGGAVSATATRVARLFEHPA